MLLPAITVAGALFVIETSACEVIVVLAVALLFAGFVSALDVVAVAVLLMIVPFGIVPSGCTVSVNWALPPLAKSEIVHETVPPLFGGGVLQVAAGPVFCMSETNVRPEGRLSVNVTSAAVSGPAFVSVMM
jgi:hypothetical protein